MNDFDIDVNKQKSPMFAVLKSVASFGKTRPKQRVLINVKGTNVLNVGQCNEESHR